MPPGENKHWAKKLSEWEADVPGPPRPGDALWDRLDASLPPPKSRKKGAYWWYLLGALLFLGLTIGLGHFLGNDEAEMLAGESPVEETATELEATMGTDQSVTDDKRTSTEAAGKTEELGRAEEKAKATADAPGTTVSSQGNNKQQVENVSRIKPAPRSQSKSSDLPPSMIKETENPGTDQLDQPSTTSTASTTTGTNAVITNSQGAAEEFDSGGRFPGSQVLPVLEITSVTSLYKFVPFDLDDSNIGLEKFMEAAQQDVEWRSSDPTTVFSLQAGPTFANYRVMRPNEERPEGFQQRIWDGVGGHLNLRASRKKWFVELGLSNAKLKDEITFNRPIRIERERETLRTDGTREGKFSLDLKSIDNTAEPANITVRRNPAQFINPNPTLILELEELTEFNQFSIPLKVGYRQPLWNSPFSVETNAGISRTWATFERSVALQEAMFANGVRPQFFELADRSSTTDFNYWSYSLGGAVTYGLKSAPLELRLGGDYVHSIGDWIENRPDDRFLQGIELRLSVGYRF
ncbi:hypothetical protein [Lewinella sp. 4G2]|uniref:hypothetical protein n=1 Tax=Lewinella sp. 4G2 TaxID=1803372 RepID=UPI0007B4A241|nr:hypothetical protein [Lewinella sp. 4G2]OAV44880.1 hypothetical protein A3850_010425 [Lewinella sp. 4G2]